MKIYFPTKTHNGVTMRNLVNLVYSYGNLISKAAEGKFGADKELVEHLKEDSCTFSVTNFLNALKTYENGLSGIEFSKENVCFTGFPDTNDENKLTAFEQLAELMNNQAVSQKLIRAKQVDESNEKFVFRAWLMRIGMKGEKFKTTRKVLLKNLSGCSAFKEW